MTAGSKITSLLYDHGEYTCSYCSCIRQATCSYINKHKNRRGEDGLISSTNYSPNEREGERDRGFVLNALSSVKVLSQHMTL